ncbi:MAG: DUF4173 domain-containing protein [Oscillospiraceae bacterium]
MNEIQKIPAPASEPFRFSARDWAALAMALGLALLWQDVFGLAALFSAPPLPGLGAAAATAAIWAAVLLYLGREAKWTRLNAALATGVALLALACVIYADSAVRLINYLLILCGSALCFFSLSGSAISPLSDVRVVTETFLLTFRALFSGWFKPFRAAAALNFGDKKSARGVLLGLLAAIPLLSVVIALLCMADAVFASLFSGISDLLLRMDAPTAVLRLLRTLICTLIAFSAIYFLRHTPESNAGQKKRAAASATPFVIVLALLDIVCIVFVAIQFAFLFGGAETAAMQGGYAEYARSGFFQLVKVAAINLGCVLICAVFAGDKTVTRIMSTILLALTAVILFSALRRMQLYTDAYGMSLLRAMTLWAMAFIAVCLLLAGLRIWRPDFKFWPFFAAVGLAGWIIFNFINIDARIADYNVDAYLGGRLEDVDIYYLSRLSPDALPALERLRDSVGGSYKGGGDSDFYLSCDLDDAINYAQSRSSESWSALSLSYVRYK